MAWPAFECRDGLAICTDLANKVIDFVRSQHEYGPVRAERRNRFGIGLRMIMFDPLPLGTMLN